MPQDTGSPAVDALRRARAANGGNPLASGGQKQAVATPPQAAQPGQERGLLDQLGDVVKGAAKGVGETGSQLIDIGTGKMPMSWVGIGNDSFEPQSGAENIGKSIEQLLEFFAAGGPTRKLAQKGTKAAATHLAKNMATKPGLNRTAASAQRVGKANRIAKAAKVPTNIAADAASAGGVSAIHDGSPSDVALAGGLSGGGSAAGAGLGALIKALGPLAKSPFGQQVLSYLMAGAATAAAPTKGIGQQLGGFGLARMGSKRMLNAPGFIDKAGNAADASLRHGSRAMAGSIDITDRPQRRRLGQ